MRPAFRRHKDSDYLWQTLFKRRQNQAQLANLEDANRPRRLSQLANGTQTRQNPTAHPEALSHEQYNHIVRLTDRDAAYMRRR